jgi:AcrR family transcriptional regulator
MKNEDIQESKLKILKAAEKLFAENGFNGARVDDIAKMAGVNKALIYYYFNSKKDILNELFNKLIKDMVNLTYNMVESSFERFESYLESDDMTQDMEGILAFMESKKDTLKIMMMESLKKSEEPPPIFRFSEIAMNDEAERMKDILRNRGFSIDELDLKEALIADFFTGIIPIINFVVYRDRWGEYFQIDPEELRRKFSYVFQITHLAYHKVQLAKLV